MPHSALIAALAIAGAFSAGVLAYSFGAIPALDSLVETVGVGNNNSTIIVPESADDSTAVQPIASNDSSTIAPILTIAITYPIEGSIVRGTTEALVEVSGNVDVELVEGYLDNELVDTEISAPYEFTIPTMQFADGAHKFKVVAHSGSGMNATTVVNITIENLVNIPPPGSYPAPVPLGVMLPSAEQVFISETFRVPDKASNFIILIPNEAHHLNSEPEALISETNGQYLPTNVEISKMTSITFLSNDQDHFHTTVVTNEKDGKVIWETSSIAPAQFTESKSFANEDLGRYLFASDDPDYEDMRGSITVRESIISPTGATVGCIYVPQEDLPRFREIFGLRGFAIESEHNFTWDNSNQDTDDQTLIVFSTMHQLPDALSQLAAIVVETPYD